ncbi:MAG: hypothetical protein BGO82_14300 [Devosia sp. 67-54]|uniref:hypothetical protein n=1 Tax=unclassified Devosia TaxID=196773 RepID=UPI0009673D47|nr:MULTISPECIES: hypothetical protein [unclassified Devosia]MBN9306794.1 hypothetical protein [Devosia sp.]OJX16044.1 MAG: hypothetical protein BGO82_14300 [Devosia sp. 67-54]
MDDSIELAVDICDDIAELSIADDGIADVSAGVDEVSAGVEAEVSAGADELSMADEEAIEASADEEDCANAPPISRAVKAVPVIKSRIIGFS